MPKNDSDDENDMCCLVGTPLLDLIPEDAKFSVKAKRPEEQIVTDERGRQRFHGAFTGGFSAGYFNSVGSKEGWAPSSFKSSRSDRPDKKGGFQRPEDFMDEEDFSEHGIAPKALKVRSDYKEHEPTTGLKKPVDLAGFSFDDMIKPTRSTLGVRMLKKMGWREGQGIGPRIKRKLRKLRTKIAHEPGKKIYGVALPSESDESDLDEEQEDEYLVSTFDINEFQFEIKEDLFGLGYKRLDVGSLFGQEQPSSATGGASSSSSSLANLLFPTMAAESGKKNKSIAGQAFGVGDFEDDEDIDVYQQDAIGSYYHDLDSQKHQEAKRVLNKSYGFGAFEDDVAILRKFAQSQRRQQPAKVFPAPVVPAGFDLTHKFARKFGARPDESASATDDAMNVYLKSMGERAQALGETPLQVESVFDLMKPSDREFLQQKRQAASSAVIEEPKKPEPSRRDELEQAARESKARRYESFVGFVKKNYKDPYSFVDSASLTEWEKQQEKAEFERRYEAQLKLVEAAKAGSAKFVSAATLNAQNVEVPSVDASKGGLTSTTTAKENEEVELSDLDKAVREKKYGAKTRVEFEWRPHNTLCKRFNVPNPFPDAKEVGTVRAESGKRAKMQKLSVFDFLNADVRFDQKTKKNLAEDAAADRAAVAAAEIDQDRLAGMLRTEFEAIRKGLPVDEPAKASSEPPAADQELKVKFKSSATEEEDGTGGEALRDDNIYLQERPDIDLFRAIFEDDDEEEEEEEAPPPAMEEEEEEEAGKAPTERVEPGRPTETLASSVGAISVKDVSRYLKKAEDEDDGDYLSLKKDFKEPTSAEPRILFRKKETPSSTSALVKEEPEAVRFSKLLKTLAKSAATAETRSSSDDSASSSSDSSSDSVEEIVYEEVSISKPGDDDDNDDKETKPKKSSKKSSSKSKKHKHKHKHHKKSSKKSKKSKKAKSSSSN